jgi:hypothetical protein
MSTANITHMGVDLVVTYDYEPAERQTLEYPGCPEQLDVVQVNHKGEDITELLDWEMVESIAQKLLEDRSDSIRQAEEDRAEARWQDQQDRIAEGDYL